MLVDLLTKNEENAYECFLDECPFSSAQFSLAWRNVICDMGEDKPYFVVAKENNEIVGALPLYYYRGKFGNLLTTNAWHTISGILCARNADRKSIYKGLMDYSLALAKELDCTVLSISTNPFQDDKEYYLDYFQPHYLMENFVQYICLNEIFDENGNTVHPNYIKRSNLSRNLKRAKMQKIAISDEQTQDNVDQCFRIHEKRMGDLRAVPFPKKFFDSVLRNLTSKGKFLFAFHREKMVAGCLFLSHKNIMDVYMMCMDSECGGLGTNFIITDYMLRWAYKNEIQILHWMSSPRRGDGVYKWKEQWGSHEGTFSYLTRVIGDISQWQNMNCSELNNAYRFHYLLPFNLLKNPQIKSTTKDELSSFIESI